MPRLRSVPLMVLAAALVAAVPQAAFATPSPGSPSDGDPYFPTQGNGGYDVQHYGLDVHVTPSSEHISGVAQISAIATQDLSRFDLDLRPNLRASNVLVNGVKAGFNQPTNTVQELVVTPATALESGKAFTVAVTYAGRGKPIIDPDGSPDGYIPTEDGVFIASEPQGSPGWFPVNDNPADKARYDVSMTVPDGLTAVGNGELVGVTHRGGNTTWSWHLGRPASSYLITATFGHFDLHLGTTPAGVPYTIAVDPAERAGSANALVKLPQIVDYFSTVYGAYPWGYAGAIIDNAPQVGYALETVTRPVFDRAPDELTLAHELAHQWFGDDVTLTQWHGIWLNEGFAEFSSWLWDEHRGGESTDEHLKHLLLLPASNPVWNPPPADPGDGANIFDDSVYERGAGTLAALRVKLGDKSFFTVLRDWVQTNAYANGTVREFIAAAEKDTGVDLSDFFDQWLYRPGKPSSPEAS